MSTRDALVRAHEAGQLLKAIKAATSAKPDERKALASELTELHNEGEIDVVAAFSELRRTPDSRPGFFLVRHLLEEVLPELEAPVPETCRCVLTLYLEAGNDMAAGTIFNPFLEFCAKHTDRIQTALGEIEAASADLADLLVPVLVAGSRVDLASYATETLRLARHPDIELRRRALFAIGCLEWDGLPAREEVVAVLEEAAQHESDDHVLGNIVKSASALMTGNEEADSRLVCLVSEALSNGGEAVLHAASQVFGLQTSKVSAKLLAVFLERLAQVKVANRGTLDNLDYGVAYLLQGTHSSEGLAFLETILLAHPGDLDLAIFDDAAGTIRDTPGLRNKVATRWLLTGEPVLCAGIEAIVDSRLGDPLEIEADAGEISDAGSSQLLFAARKAVGYLFQEPVAATSFVLSLLRQRSSDSELRAELEALLLNPLLINFSGKVAEYLTRRAESVEEPVKSAIRTSLDALATYLDGLKVVGEIPELHPSLEHREAYRRHFAGKMTQSLKEAQEDSVLLQLVHTSVLLYGRKAIHHFPGPGGKIHRTETNLGAHGAEMEVPRMTVIDPLGLDCMVSIFRAEKLIS